MQSFTGVCDTEGLPLHEGDSVLVKGKCEYPKRIVFESGAYCLECARGNVPLHTFVKYKRKFYKQETPM